MSVYKLRDHVYEKSDVDEYLVSAAADLANITADPDHAQLAIVVGDGSGSELYCRLPGEQSFTKM